MPQLDFSTFSSQIIWLALIFSAFYFLVSRIFAPKIRDQVEKRTDFIDRELSAAAAARDIAANATTGSEAALAKAREVAGKEIASAKLASAKDAEERLKHFEHELSIKLNDSEARISSARQAAMQSLETSVSEIAETMFQKLTVKTST